MNAVMYGGGNIGRGFIGMLFSASGYDVTFINSHVGNQPTSYVKHCRYRGLDGVLVACIDFTDPRVVELVDLEDLISQEVVTKIYLIIFLEVLVVLEVLDVVVLIELLKVVILF